MSTRISKALMKTTMMSFLLLAPPISDAIEKKGDHLYESKNNIVRLMGDGWRKGTIEAAYLLNKNIDSDSLQVSVDNNTAILHGTVSSPVHKSLAQEIALSVEGITKVTNNIAIDPATAPEPVKRGESKQNKRDALLAARIHQQLLLNEHMGSSEINVHSHNGVIELSGEAPHDSIKDLAYYLAKNAKGVVSVDNKIRVKSRT